MCMRQLRQEIIDLQRSKLILERVTYWDNRERADEIFRDYEQPSSVVKLTTVVGSTKHCHQLKTHGHTHNECMHTSMHTHTA